ncbi:MAG: hypothetical protein ACRDPO_29530 [Streptosporangiaceae bacterium]
MEFRFKRPPAEALKSLTFKNDDIERIKAEGRFETFDEGQARAFVKAWDEKIAKEAAEFLLQLLARRDLTVPASLRERVLSCVDLEQLGTWIEMAGIAASVEDVFPD